MKQKFYCGQCKTEMKFKDTGNSLVMYCPKCEIVRMLEKPNGWEKRRISKR